MSEQQKQRVDALMRGGEFGGGATPAAMRAGFQRLMAGMAVPAGIVTADREIAGRPALEVLPDGERHVGTILYFHGGAFIFGDPRTALGLTAALVVRTGVAALSLDYRLAPEHPFPAAIEDGVAAYRALLDAGADPASVAVAGDSAGGALTITTLLAARDAGLPMPACAVAFSPSLDATRSGASMSTKAGIDPVFTREGLRAMEGHYQAGHDRRDPLLSPALTADPAGLPPLLLQAGSHEVLLDDAVRFAARAAEADVDVVLDVTAGVPHVFQSFQGVLDEADAALDRAGLFLRQHLPR